MARSVPSALSLACITPALAFAACNSGTRSAPATPATPFVLAAGMETLAPETGGDLLSRVDLRPLGLSGRIDQVYRLTTPADRPFSFDVLTRTDGNAGDVRVSVAHVADGGAVPQGGVESIAAAGFVPSATGLINRVEWLDAHGDGFARMTLGGAIRDDQVLVFETEGSGEVVAALVEVAIGPASAINEAARPGGNHPGVVDEATLYSSDSWMFGLPTVAVSGDRTSVVVYEGDRSDWQRPQRYELRLQHAAANGSVTGGGSDEASPDSGHWRDHEIAALFNVLALAHCGTGEVTLKLSYDRGATFVQNVTLESGSWSTRLVQIAMAADYSLAVTWWRSMDSTRAELVVVQGRPSGYDISGSPTWFAFDPPRVLHSASGDVSPLLMGMQWSEGGDLVVGYAFTELTSGPERTWTSTTEFWCAVQPWGGEFREHPVDQDIIVGRDPGVALLGSGSGLRIFYAYEGREGVRLRASNDAGMTFSHPVTIGGPGAHTPAVFARQDAGATRVDVLYLTQAGSGTELHLDRWLDYPASGREEFRLTTAVLQPTANVPGGGGNAWTGPLHYGHRLTQVAWFGYDAVLDGNEIVVVYDEETFDAAFVCLGAFSRFANTGGFLNPTLSSPGFQPANPPPLAPGMTQTLPAPDPEHRHQLKLLRLR